MELISRTSPGRQVFSACGSRGRRDMPVRRGGGKGTWIMESVSERFPSYQKLREVSAQNKEHLLAGPSALVIIDIHDLMFNASGRQLNFFISSLIIC